MPRRITVELSAEQRMELEAVRSHHAKAYLRERAAAILKVADGASVADVAAHGLLKRHEHETVHGWIKRYQAEGLAGLQPKAGRGRKPKFFPPQSGAGPS